jgi:hypothetical protein
MLAGIASTSHRLDSRDVDISRQPVADFDFLRPHAQALARGRMASSRRQCERLWARVNAKAKPLKGVKVKPGTQWLKPGLVGRVRHLKGEQQLRHATLLDRQHTIMGGAPRCAFRYSYEGEGQSGSKTGAGGD